MTVVKSVNSVVKMTANADAITYDFETSGIKLVCTAYTSAGAVTIRNAAGTVDVWTSYVAAVGEKPFEPVEINLPGGFNIDVTGTFTFILYVYPKN